MPLALSRDPGPTPSVGHVTGDMKRRESNETQVPITSYKISARPCKSSDVISLKYTDIRGVF